MPDSSSDGSDLPTGLGLTGLDETFRNEPHPILDRLRVESPVHYDPGFNVAYITRNDACRAVLSDKTLSRDPRKTPEGSIVRLRAPKRIVSGEFPPVMMWLDDPEHRRQRGLMTKAFSLRAVQALRPRMEEIVEKHLDDIEKKGAFDGVADYAWRVPIFVIAEMLGLPEADMPQFYEWSMTMADTLNPFVTPEQDEKLQATERNFERYTMEKIAERRLNPGDDLISRLALVELDGEMLSDEEIASLCTLIILAGNITTTDLIGNGIVHLLTHPEELEKLKANPELIRGAIEEVLRFDPPVGATMRHSIETGEKHGCPVQPGTAFAASLMAANRDPEVFECPHEFQIERKNNDHISFGGGQHYCMGAPLAKLEGEVAIAAIFKRFPNLHLIEGVPARKVAPTFNGYDKIPLHI